MCMQFPFLYRIYLEDIVMAVSQHALEENESDNENDVVHKDQMVSLKDATAAFELTSTLADVMFI